MSKMAFVILFIIILNSKIYADVVSDHDYNIDINIAAEDFNPLLRIAPIAWDMIDITVNEFYTTITIVDFHKLVIEDYAFADVIRKLITEEITNYLSTQDDLHLLEDFIHTNIVSLIYDTMAN